MRNLSGKAFLTVMVLTLICCASCKKEKETEMVTLKLALEQPTDPSNQKVYLDDQKLVCWYGEGYTLNYNVLYSVNVEDKIKINNNTYYVKNNTTVVPSSSTYIAVYPAKTTANDNNTVDVDNHSVTVTIPAVQTYTPGPGFSGQNLKDLPMAAYLDPSESGVPPVLMFRNLASLIKVRVHNPNSTSSGKPFRLNSIKLSSTNGQPLHGKFTYTFSHSTNNIGPGTSTTSGTQPAYNSEVMLDFNHTWELVPAGGYRDYYVVVAPFTNCNFRIQIRGAVLGSSSSDGYSNGEAIKVRTKTFSASKSLVRSRIGTIDADLSSSSYWLSGAFHKSTNDSCYFSIGNLTRGYNASNAPTWVFNYSSVGEQYHCLGSSHNKTWWSVSNRAGQYLDLFPYNEVYISGAANPASYSVGTYYPIDMSYKDQSAWFCPEKSEWYTMIFSRSASAVSGTSNARYAKATISSNYRGVILFPDKYIQPNIGININNVNTTNASFSGNNLNHAQWKLMEAAGAVFLPATERIFDYSLYGMGFFIYPIDANSNTGYYWGIGPNYNYVAPIYYYTYSRLAFNDNNIQNNSEKYYLEDVDGIEGDANTWGVKRMEYIHMAIRTIRN